MSVLANSLQMSNAFDDILLALDSTQDKRELFNILNDKLADQENPNLQMHIKFCSFLLKSQPMAEVEEYFTIVFNNFYAVSTP